MTKKKWVKDAIKEPGSFTKKAKAAGKMTKKGTINKDWVDKVADNKKNKFSKKTQKQAVLAENLAKMKPKKK